MSKDQFHPPERRVPPSRVDKNESNPAEAFEGFAEDHYVISRCLLAIALKATDQEVPETLKAELAEMAMPDEAPEEGEGE